MFSCNSVKFATFVAALLSFASTAESAILLSVTSDVQLNGAVYHYQYTIENDATSTLSATDFALDVSPLANLQSIIVPADWVIGYNAGDVLFYAFSPDFPSDIAPGATAVISFDSLLAPDTREYSVFALDANTFDFETVFGTTQSPTVLPTAAAVPEPATFSMFCILGICVAARCRRTNRKFATEGDV